MTEHFEIILERASADATLQATFENEYVVEQLDKYVFLPNV